MARPWSNVMLLEHVNLNVNLACTSHAALRALYCGALGLAEDPRPAQRGRSDGLLWVNAGLSQVHLPCEAGAAPAAAASQRVDGCIGVLLARGALAAGGAVAQGLASAPCPPALQALRCRATPCLYLPPSAATLGNAYLLEEAEAQDERYQQWAGSGHPCLPMAAGGGAAPAPPPALGLTMVQLRVPAAALPHISTFFAAVLGARVEARSSGSALAVFADGAAVEGHGRQALLFTAAGEREAALLPYDGWHVALYLRDFQGAWAAAQAAGLLHDNPRFADRCGTWAQALEHHQFRTLLLGAESGCCMELEVRSLSHPHCPLAPLALQQLRQQQQHPPPPRNAVLSIQSHVVWGHVGNCAATLPLQALGWEVSPLNTVHLATHTGYPVVKGQRLGAGEVGAVLEGLRASGVLGRYRALLTGYTPSAELLSVYTGLVGEMRALRAAAGSAQPLLYVCDPVLGDEEAPAPGGHTAAAAAAPAPAPAAPPPFGRLYVPADLIPKFIAHIASSHPTILTPNAFEAAQLTGRASSIGSLEDALQAMDALHAMGARCVVMTSTWIERAGGAMLLLGSAPWEDLEGEGGAGPESASAGGAARFCHATARRQPQASPTHGRFGISMPRLPAAFTGTGDLTAALLLANYAAHPGCFARAVEVSVAAVQAACRRTLEALVVCPPPVGASRGDMVAATELRVLETMQDYASPVLPSGLQAFAL